MNNVDKMVETLDGVDKPSLGQIADRLAALFGTRLDTPAPKMTPPPELVVEQTEFDVLLADTGPKKIEVIKAVREVTGLGLKEAKDFVEKTTERSLKAAADKETALSIQKKLEAAGAKVVLR